MTSPLGAAARIVVKIGSTLLTNDGRGLDHAAVARWAGEIAQLKSARKAVVLVSSGAIAEGMQRLGWSTRPRAIHELQAAAAVGQMGLVQAYEAAFSKYGLHTAQVLLTHEDLADRRKPALLAHRERPAADRREAVDLGHHDTEAVAAAARALDLVVEHLGEGGGVVEAGHGVGAPDVREALDQARQARRQRLDCDREQDEAGRRERPVQRR